MLEVSEVDREFMSQALVEAKVALANGEVPVGAVVVHDGEIIGRGGSQQISTNDPTAHAEIVALRAAAQLLSNYRVVDTTLYVTLEPCMMCAGALVHARVARLVYGCDSDKTGVVRTHGSLLDWTTHNHSVEVTRGVLAKECSALISTFFTRQRKLG